MLPEVTVPPGRNLLLEQAWRKGLPVDSALELGMLLLERGDQRGHREEVVAADIEHELRIGDVAMEIREVVDLGNRERKAARRGVVVRPVLPGWTDRVPVRLRGMREERQKQGQWRVRRLRLACA